LVVVVYVCKNLIAPTMRATFPDGLTPDQKQEVLLDVLMTNQAMLVTLLAYRAEDDAASHGTTYEEEVARQIETIRNAKQVRLDKLGRIGGE
jgi:hypothetical protein